MDDRSIGQINGILETPAPFAKSMWLALRAYSQPLDFICCAT
jgi:hypothetical protein